MVLVHRGRRYPRRAVPKGSTLPSCVGRRTSRPVGDRGHLSDAGRDALRVAYARRPPARLVARGSARRAHRGRRQLRASPVAGVLDSRRHGARDAGLRRRRPSLGLPRAATLSDRVAGADAGRGQPVARRTDPPPRDRTRSDRAAAPRRGCALRPARARSASPRSTSGRPSDERARDVAEALLADPADPRTLHDWGHAVGASSRTLARAFLSDTGLSFGRWRTLVSPAGLAALPRGADDR